MAIAAKGGWLGLKDDGTIPGMPQASNITAIAAGHSHNLAVSNGFVFGWGDAAAGETTAPPELNNAVALSAGVQDSLALTVDGSVIC